MGPTVCSDGSNAVTSSASLSDSMCRAAMHTCDMVWPVYSLTPLVLLCTMKCMHAYTQPHTHIHTPHTHMHTSTHTHPHTYAYMHTCMQTSSHTYMHAHTNVHAHTLAHAHTHIHTHTHTHTHTRTHTHTHTHNNPPLTILVCSPNTSSKAWRQQSVMSCPAKTHLLCQAVLVSELSEVSDVLSGLQ